MKKILFLFMLLTLASCRWFDDPAEAERIGCGYVQNDHGLLVVEIDGVKYSPDIVYTGISDRVGKNKMEAVAGMQITVFRLRDNPDVEFISGDRNKEFLDKYFKENYTILVVFMSVLLLFCALALLGEKPQKVKKVSAD